MPHRLTVFLLLSICFAVLYGAVPAQEKFAVQFNDSRYESLARELTGLQQTNPKLFKDEELGYLLARALEKRGDFAGAIASYQNVVVLNRSLKPFALKHLSRLLRESGNYPFERLFLNEVIFAESRSTPGRIARNRIVQSYFESGDFTETIDIIENGLPTASSVDLETGGNDRELSVILGKSYLRLRKLQKAREVFNGLVGSVPDPAQPDDFALEAVRGLDLLETGESKFDTEVKNLVATEQMERADIYQFNRNFGRARLHYLSMVINHIGNSSVPESMAKIARGYDQERDYKNAIVWSERLISEFPKDKLAPAALYAAAGAYAASGNNKEAINRYERFISENPAADNPERAYLNIIDAYRDENNQAKALEWTEKARKAFPGKPGETAAQFAESRIYIAAEDWKHALDALSQLEAKDLRGSNAGATNISEVRFLKGFVLEQLKRYPEAIETFMSIDDGRSEYYGLRASERLRNLGRSPQSASFVEQRIIKLRARSGILTAQAERPLLNEWERLEPRAALESLAENYKAIPEYKTPAFEESKPELQNTTASRLYEFGLFDEAAPEIEISSRSGQTNGGTVFSGKSEFMLAALYSKGGFAERGIRFIEPRWKKIPRDFQIELIPKEQAQLLYPVPYRDSLLKYGKKYNVDPRLLLSIMRQESRFQADIKSAAAARGLMQFVSGTSRKMADELKLKDFRQDDLYDPDTAIRFGAFYISKIFKDFPDKPEAVAASYNGGEDRMARWLKRSNTTDADRYVAEIVFSQTRDYVYKVMSNYRMYELLYDESLTPRHALKN